MNYFLHKMYYVWLVSKYRETTKPSLIGQKWYIIWRVYAFLGYVEPPKVNGGLTHWFTWTENCTQSTTEIVVQYSTIDDIPQCTTMHIYLRGGSRRFHNGGHFISETISSYKYQNIPRRNSRKITRHGNKKNDKDEIGNVLLNIICFYPSIN